MADTLKTYREKRNFTLTSEPAEGGEANPDALAFVVQKHWASRLHYDFRLELDGAMKSWAVPKGPTYDPTVKRMAVQVEDHPIAYNQFEGEIPKGQYGAGKVIIWDEGVWQPLSDPSKGYRDGHLKFELHGAKLHGRWALVRMKGKGEKQVPWLLIKEKDALAKPESEFSLVDEYPDSVVPLRGERRDATSTKRGAKGAGRAAAKTAPARAATQARVPADSRSGRDKADGETPADHASADGAASGTDLPGRAAPLPETLRPQLATLVERPPHAPGEWIHELKFDGYRVVARLDRGEARLFTRNGHDWTAQMPQLARAISALPVENAWIDGEIVVMADDGNPSFQALQNAFDQERAERILFYAFDLPYVTGRDLREEPLWRRREILEQVIARGEDPLRFSAAFDKPVSDLVASACKLGLEGIIAKRRDAPYVTRRSDTWIKLKCARRQEFVIAGYTEPQGSRVGLGALVLAVHDQEGALRHAGNVGTGFDDRMLEDLVARLRKIERADSPLAPGAKPGRKVHWVEPRLVAEVSFGEWTGAGHVRHAVYRGLREDKPASAIVRETPERGAGPADADADTGTAKARSGRGKAGAGPKGRAAAVPDTDAASDRQTGSEIRAPTKKGNARAKAAQNDIGARARPGRLTSPDRVIDEQSGATKLDLARYYALVAPQILPHLSGRPTSFLRAPAGIGAAMFFQKHLEHAMPGVRTLPQELDPDHPPLLEVPSDTALMSAVQMNVVEFHTWNAHKDAIDKPDRMVFDLDPGEGVQWNAVVEGAQLVRTLLQELDLTAWLKTSGGKGLHVVVPLRRQHDWDTVKRCAQAIVRHLAQTVPQRFVAKSGPRNRVGKIFVDYLRNGFGATTVAAWSARARPGLGVSVPLAWDELKAVKRGDQWTVRNIHERLDVGDTPWDDYSPQSLTTALKAFE
ncbi:DNA ligase D [Pseudomonadota bacterium AL_CKDN230030165-1A_HGKHYDSX7]